MAPNATSFLLVDVANIYCKAKFKMGDLSTSDGRRTGGLYGFIRMITAAENKHNTELTYLCMEGRGASQRQLTFPEYKADRDGTPIFEEGDYYRIRDWAKLSGRYVAHDPNCEADDVIASLARNVFSNSLIFSADHDMRALLRDDDDKLCRILRDSSKPPYTLYDFTDEFEMQPSDYQMALALAGDSSDNIPGIPKVGIKTAWKIMTDNDKSWEAILADDRVKDYADQVSANMEIVTFRDTSELTITSPELDRDALNQFYGENEFNSLVT